MAKHYRSVVNHKKIYAAILKWARRDPGSISPAGAAGLTIGGMRIFSQRLSGGVVLVLATLLHGPATGQATSDQGAVATVHPVATRAGLAVLAEGGNAVDAAIAAALTLGVVDCHNSGIGGGVFYSVASARREVDCNRRS